MVRERARRQPFLIAIAGGPGAGKSTLAALLERSLGAGNPDKCVTVAMDGYHLDNGIIESMGLLHRKGAPETFNAAGLLRDIVNIRAGRETVVPVFDRTADLARANARIVPSGAEFVIVEGNYLLLDSEPWKALRPCFDMTVFLQVGYRELEQRLIQRWLEHGLDPASARARAESNDLANARLVELSSVEADFVIDQGTLP